MGALAKAKSRVFASRESSKGRPGYLPFVPPQDGSWHASSGAGIIPWNNPKPARSTRLRFVPTLYAVYFEATSRWDSQYDGLLVNVNRRLTHNISYGLSYTWSKTIDDGPNPSFVLIPQDSQNFREERALSSDDVRNRLVLNGTLTTPNTWNVFARDFLLGAIVTVQSPQRFTKFAGFDANGDIFGNNDRVGIEPRNTFAGDNFRTFDLRLARTFSFREKRSLQFIAEAFNLSNTLNVRFFNTVYGAADFCPFNATAQGCPATPSGLREGSPNPLYGTPRAVNNPRQVQLALKFNF